jgi:hypothetical protein
MVTVVGNRPTVCLVAVRNPNRGRTLTTPIKHSADKVAVIMVGASAVLLLGDVDGSGLGWFDGSSCLIIHSLNNFIARERNRLLWRSDFSANATTAINN